MAAVSRLYRNRKGTAIYRSINSAQKNTKTQNTQNRKQKYKTKNKHKKNIKKNIIRVIIKEQKESNNNGTTYCTEPTYSYININQYIHFTQDQHITSPPFTSFHFPSLHFTSFHFPSLNFTSLYFTSLHFHFTSLHLGREMHINYK